MRFDRLLAGSAIALVLTAGAAAQAAGATTVSARAGLPESISLEGDLQLKPSALGTPRQNTPPVRVGASDLPTVEPAPVVITADDVAPPVDSDATKAVAETASSAPAAASEPAAKPRLPAGLRIEANADPDATSSIMPATPLTAPTAAPAAEAPAAASRETAKPTAPETAPAAATPTVPAPPQIALSPFGDKLRTLIGDQSDRSLDRDTRGSLSSFYTERNFTAVWTENGVVTPRAKAAMAQLAAAADDGLDPDDYVVPALAANADPAAQAEFELKLDKAVTDYARHAAVGRVHWSRVSHDIVYETKPPAAAEVLAKLSTEKNARAALDSYNPQHRYYKALKAKLAEIRGGKEPVQAHIASGPVLKAGMKDARVPALRERLGVAGDAADTTYDDALADAVKAFQKDKKIAANGRLTDATVDALNGKAAPQYGAHTVDVILANMERWRWVPHDLGGDYVIVNIPEFMLRLYHNDSLLWQTRVVVGKPDKATPLLTETMKYITVNPTWNVPPSIVYGEYLPALRQDPTVLARMGLRVSYAGGGVHVSQPPGEGNALGRIRFNFPNKFLVYQHDTPDKYMFAHTKRAYSHGCMRVQNPDQYAEALLSIALPQEHYTAARIRGMYGRGEVDIKFPTPIPVNLTYQTAYVDDAGKLVLSDDVYGRDTRTIAALKSDDRRYASAPAAAPAERSAARRSARREAYRYVPPAPQRSGFNFFGLFR